MKAKELKRIREEELKCSAAALAEQLGVSRSAVIRWESGSRPIPLVVEKLLAFLRAYKTVTPSDKIR